MKLKNEYVTYPMDENEIMVGTGASGFKGMVKMNKSAAYIISCLKEETDEKAVVEKMLEKYDADRDIIEKDVAQVIAALRSIGALDE